MTDIKAANFEELLTILKTTEDQLSELGKAHADALYTFTEQKRAEARAAIAQSQADIEALKAAQHDERTTIYDVQLAVIAELADRGFKIPGK